MRSRPVVVPFVALLVAAVSRAPAQTVPTAPADAADALSARNASYRIEARLDPEARTIDGREVLTWRNVERQPTSELCFHLYWNAWRNNRSTWMLESRLRGRGGRSQRIDEGDWGFIEVSSIRLLPSLGYPEADLTPEMRFVSPDDGNPDDRTVMKVALPTPVGPRETVQLEIAWRAKIPRTFARTGFRGDFFFIAQWFPKVGVLERGGWNCHQFHAATEFYADYGAYDVSLTVPSRFTVGATGKRVELEQNANGTHTHRFLQADVHDFAWTASPDYVVEEARFEEPGLPPVEMTLLLQPEHRDQADRHFEATRAALRSYGEWYGAYPYGHLTIVDPAYGSGAGGMEYPTLFTAGTRLFNPFGGGSPERVTVHECGHQFWYGIVGNNEFEHAWLDEGLNTFSAARVMEETYGPSKLVRRYLRPPGGGTGFFPLLFEDIELGRMVSGNRLDGYRAAATAEVPATPTFRYHPGTASAISYNKTALWLTTLERHLGWETLREGMSLYFERWKFRHPRPEDFFAALNEAAGEDLSWFFDQVHGTSVAFDYAIASVATDPVRLQGFAEQEGRLAPVDPAGPSDLYRSEVVVRRNGEGVFPVDVLMVFEDGTEIRKRWDGRDRWRLYVEERPSRLEYAAVDPERTLALDLSFTNNSRRVAARAVFPARKWASRWMIWLQDLLVTFAFFV